MEEVLAAIRKFRDERDWLKFHDPQNLAASVAIEAAELLEEFQWKDREASWRHAEQNREAVADEIADVAIYLFELADILKIDVGHAILAKLEKNAVKYPVDKSRGKSTKYDKL
jgi:dCTP diphosphatase